MSLSHVTLDSVYFYGPNIDFDYLYFDHNATNLAVSNNFTKGSLGTNQAWFSVDVSVSTPQSGEDTLFKLYQGQNGVYNFVAVVDVEWYVANSPLSVTPMAPVMPFAAPFASTPQTSPTTTPSSSPFASTPQTPPPFVPTNEPFTFKKRMTLQGSVSNQGSQFTAQVQIAGPSPSSQQVPQQVPVVGVSTPPKSDQVSSSVQFACSLFVTFVIILLSLF